METDETKNDASNLNKAKITDKPKTLQSKTSSPTTEKVNSVVAESLQLLKHRIQLHIKYVSV